MRINLPDRSTLSASTRQKRRIGASIVEFRRWAASRLLCLRRQLTLHTVLRKPLFSRAQGWLLLGAALMPLPLDKRLKLHVAALRRFERGFGLSLARRTLSPWLTPRRVSIWRERRIGWQRYREEFSDARETALGTSLLLKEPGPNGEKGVLYSSFEYNWLKILASKDPRAFFRDYLLVGASSWSPGDPAILANLCGISNDPIFIGISNHSDTAQYEVFAPNVIPLPIMACDWCDPDFFEPRPHRQRDIDIVMVAHFAHWKRHWLLFEALRKMPKNLHVVLIGRQHPGRGEHEIRLEAEAFGVHQELTILAGLEANEVMQHQCNAKIALICSKREGSCVAVTEALFADTPVVMMRDAHIGARVNINAQTGKLASRRDLRRTLMEMIEHSTDYSPRAWAMAHITAQQSSAKLDVILRDYCLAAGHPWTQDIAPLCWRYVPRYLDESDVARLRPGVERLRERHGIELEEFVSEADARRRHNHLRRLASA